MVQISNDCTLHVRNLKTACCPPKSSDYFFVSQRHDRTESSCTASTSRCPIQSLRKVCKALYGTTEGTCNAHFFCPFMFHRQLVLSDNP